MRNNTEGYAEVSRDILKGGSVAKELLARISVEDDLNNLGSQWPEERGLRELLETLGY